MSSPEIPFLPDIPTLGSNSGRLFLNHLKSYVERCDPNFPASESSLQVIEKVRSSGLVERMVQVELEGKHSLFSHSLLVCAFVASVSRQINQLTTQTIGTRIIDEPLVVTSSTFHDIGNLIAEEDIERFGIAKVDISPFINAYPESSPWRDLRKNHILKTVAFLQALGFPQHAHTAAHSIYHLIESGDVTIERLLLMLGDFSVVEATPKEGEWLRADYGVSFIYKMDQALAKHRGELQPYFRFHDQLQAVKSYLETLGVIFPRPLMGDGDDLSSRLSLILNYLRLRDIERQSMRE